MTMISVFARTACAGGLLLAGVSAAAAQDVEAALDRLQELLAEQTIDLEWADADVVGDRAVLSGVRAIGPDGEEIGLGDIVLTGISETDQGYRIAEMSMERYVFGEDEATVEIDGVSMTGVVLPHEGAGEAYGEFFFYETADIAELRVSMAGEEVFSLFGLNARMTPAANGEPMRFSGGAERFEADLSAIDDDTADEIIAQMGYERVSGRLDMEGGWQPADGRLTFAHFDLTVDDGGTLGFAFDIDGYTPEFVRALNELQRTMAEADDASGGMAMLGLMQQLSLHGADLYFRDDSLTGRVLEVLAEQQGMRPQDVVNQAKAVLPFALAQMGAPQLATMITEAVSQYLDDPQSIRVSARPSEPVPFALLMAGAMASPEALVQQIGVEVVANE